MSQQSLAFRELCSSCKFLFNFSLFTMLSMHLQFNENCETIKKREFVKIDGLL